MYRMYRKRTHRGGLSIRICGFDLGIWERPSHGRHVTSWSLIVCPAFCSSCPASMTGIPGICPPCFEEVISSWWLQSLREGAHAVLFLRPKCIQSKRKAMTPHGSLPLLSCQCGLQPVWGKSGAGAMLGGIEPCGADTAGPSQHC